MFEKAKDVVQDEGQPCEDKQTDISDSEGAHRAPNVVLQP